MKIHTSLNYGQLMDLIDTDPRLRDVSYISNEPVGSRTHAFGYHVHLTGNYSVSTVNGAKRRRSNSGTHGAGFYFAATFDEWGYWFAALYEADPTARCGGTIARPTYANRDDFHYRTNEAYRPTSAEENKTDGEH